MDDTTFFCITQFIEEQPLHPVYKATVVGPARVRERAGPKGEHCNWLTAHDLPGSEGGADGRAHVLTCDDRRTRTTELEEISDGNFERASIEHPELKRPCRQGLHGG